MQKIYAIEVWNGTCGTDKSYTAIMSPFYTSRQDAVQKGWEVLEYLKHRANGNVYIEFVRNCYDEDVRKKMREAGDYTICYLVEHVLVD